MSVLNFNQFPQLNDILCVSKNIKKNSIALNPSDFHTRKLNE